MARIKGRFAPLTEELGSDPRWVLDCSDFEKLMYVLIIYTCHMTHHQAPVYPRYYRLRYGIKTRKHLVKHAIDTLLQRFPKLKCSEDGNYKTLSLLNSPTYESEILPNRSLEEKKKENKKEKEKEKIGNNGHFFEKLKTNPTYKGIDVDREFGKCKAWCEVRKYHVTERRFVNWLNRVERPVAAYVHTERKPSGSCSACNGTGKLPDGKKCWCF